MENYDISQASRDELQRVLSSAKNEWRKYTNCEEDVEKQKKRIEEEKEKIVDNSILVTLIKMLFRSIFVGVAGGMIGVALFVIIESLIHGSINEQLINKLQGEKIFYISAFCAIVAYSTIHFNIATRKKKSAQSKIEEYKIQLYELQETERKAKNGLREIWKVPQTYWDDDALVVMLQYINDFEAHSWKEVTALYREYVYQSMMAANSQMTLEQARRQTELAMQTRNSARAAAFGSLASAAGIWRINSKL